MVKRKLTKLRLEEISGVDRPAQEGGLVTIFKRAGLLADLCIEPPVIIKYMRLLTDVDGHTHLIDDTQQSGETSWSKSAADEYGHSHPFVMNDDGTITIGAADGHTHSILSKRAPSAVEKAISAADRKKAATDGVAMSDGDYPIRDKDELKSAVQKPVKGKNKADVAKHVAARAHALGLTELLPTYGELADLITKTAGDGGKEDDPMTDAEKALVLAKAETNLTDSERSFFKSLGADAQSVFLKADASARAAQMANARDSDPVVYTDSEGIDYRKSSGPAVVSLAKRADASAKETAELRKRAELDVLAKRAGDELGACPGDVVAKSALLRAVDGISDPAQRTAVAAILKAGNAALKAAFNTTGTSATPAGEGDASLQMDSLAKAYAKEKGVDFYTAYEKVGEQNPDLAKRAIDGK